MVKKKLTHADHVKIGKKSKNKGRDGEQELVHYLRGYGLDARRTAQFCGKNKDAADVVCENCEAIHIECKRTETLQIYKALEQAKQDAPETKLPVVFHRKNNEEWICILSATDFLQLLEYALLYECDSAVKNDELIHRAALEAAKEERKVA